jgi:manganese/zinc/iron transport system substrate-binding protein
MGGILLMIGVVVGLIGCDAPPDNVPIHQRQVAVLTTTGMIADAVRNIGKNRVAVRALMGPGVDPHLYTASAGDITRLQDADIVFFNGLHLEAKLGDVLLEMGKTRPVVAVAAYVSPADRLTAADEPGLYDPHIWFSVPLWQKAITSITAALIACDPHHEAVYLKNADDYYQTLTQLHEDIKRHLNTVPKKHRVLLTAHDAFGYFGQTYGYRVSGLQGMSTASEASVADVNRLVDQIIAEEIPAIFIETAIPKRNILAVQDAVAARGYSVKIGGYLFADAMGKSGTAEGTYVGMVWHNVRTIVDALSE